MPNGILRPDEFKRQYEYYYSLRGTPPGNDRIPPYRTSEMVKSESKEGSMDLTQLTLEDLGKRLIESTDMFAEFVLIKDTIDDVLTPYIDKEEYVTKEEAQRIKLAYEDVGCDSGSCEICGMRKYWQN